MNRNELAINRQLSALGQEQQLRMISDLQTQSIQREALLPQGWELHQQAMHSFQLGGLGSDRHLSTIDTMEIEVSDWLKDWDS